MGVSLIILFTCPWLLPVQIAALVVITILNAKNNKIDRDSFLELAKSNRVFGYVFWRLRISNSARISAFTTART